MTVTLNLPPNLEQAFLTEAQAKGLSLDEWVCDVLLACAHGKGVPAHPGGLGFGNSAKVSLWVTSHQRTDRRRPRVSVFVLDASYTLTWCFLDRATERTDTTLKQLEAAVDSAIVPWIWEIEVANALGKGVARRKLSAALAQETWKELTLLPA